LYPPLTLIALFHYYWIRFIVSADRDRNWIELKTNTLLVGKQDKTFVEQFFMMHEYFMTKEALLTCLVNEYPIHPNFYTSQPNFK
jgi:hypothetical protein